MDKEIVIVDLDDVIVVPNFLKIANEITGENKDFKDLKEYYIEDNFSFTEEQRELFYDELVKRNLYENAKLIDGAYDTLNELSKDREIYIASAPIICRREKLSGKLFLDKFNFIVENLPFINPNNIILTGDKSIICGKYMLDDKLENLVDNRNIRHKLLFTAYHNKEFDTKDLIMENIIRIDDYKQLYRYMYMSLEDHEVSTIISQILDYYFGREINYSFEIEDKNITLILDSKDVTKKNHTFICGNIEIKQRRMYNKILKILRLESKIEVKSLT